MQRKNPKNNWYISIVISIALASVSASVVLAGDITRFTGKPSLKGKGSEMAKNASLGKAQKTTGLQTVAQTPPLPPSMPLPTPYPVLSPATRRDGNDQEKRVEWQTIGTIDGMVSLTDRKGEIIVVENGTEIDGCIVMYPRLVCGDKVAELKKEFNINKHDALVAENARLASEIATATAKIATKVSASTPISVKSQAPPVIVSAVRVEATEAVRTQGPPPPWFSRKKSSPYKEMTLGLFSAVIENDSKTGISLVTAIKADTAQQTKFDAVLKQYIRNKVVSAGHVYYQVAGLIARNSVKGDVYEK